VQWTSLPKGGPGGDPDETIFSNLQEKILDRIADPDGHGTKGGFGGFAASCESDVADPTGSLASGTLRIPTGIR
jgi:hypothetical protein